MTGHILLTLLAMSLGGFLAWKGRWLAGAALVLVALVGLVGVVLRP